MQQILIRKGQAIVESVPAPQVSPGHILVRVAHSCISVGTEMAGVQSSGLPLYRRALQQPDNVKRVIEMARDQGVKRTLDRVTGKLAAGAPTGYSAAGQVIELGAGVRGFKVGDRVACAGAGIANHAEIIDVPVNLAVAIPDAVSTRVASTVTLGAIALQGVRRAAPTLGETIVVVGLGILGQLTVQFLAANGCRVIGVDPDASRLALAAANGMAQGLDPLDSEYVGKVLALTDGFGADAVIVTAASAADEIIALAFNATRKKGRVVLVGDVGLKLRRADIYAKELDFLVSCSYGPGRYDPVYELEGQDYPIAYVRWTENRNMAAYLDLAARGKIAVDPLIAGEYPVEQATAAFDSLKAAGDRPLTLVLAYPQTDAPPVRTVAVASPPPARAGALGVAVLGAGSFVQGMHLPNMVKLGAHFHLRGVMSRTGANARAVATQYQAAYATTEVEEVLADAAVDVVIIATRHDLHAGLAVQALRAGKHVLLEKPLALSEAGLQAIEAFYRAHPDGPILMTGFNRRFAPGVAAIRAAVEKRHSPFIATYRMNAGHIAADHWVHGAEGGGRNIGEACHIYDLFLSLAKAEVVDVEARAIGVTTGHFGAQDNFAATIRFADGSLANLVYTALGAKAYPKERMEIFSDAMVLELDDYRATRAFGTKKGVWSASATDKGHFAMLEALANGVKAGEWPISLADQLAASRISLAVEAAINPGAVWTDRLLAAEAAGDA